MPAISLTITDPTVASVQIIALTDAATGITPVGVTLPATMTLSGGVYSYTFSGSGAQYLYTGQLTFTDASVQPFQGEPVYGDNPAGYYCSLTDVYDIFGTQNVAQWSNLDGGAALDLGRVATALADTDAMFNTELRGGVYAVPLVLKSGQQFITKLAAKATGIFLFNVRGQLDTLTNADGSIRPYNRYAGMMKDVYNELRNIKNGITQLDAVGSGITNTPAVANGSTRRGVPFVSGCL